MVDYNILVIGGDHYNTYGIVRSLGLQELKCQVVIQGGKRSFVLKSKYVIDGIIANSDEEIVDYLMKNVKQKKSIVYCCSDAALEFVLRHNYELKKHYILPVCEEASDTYKFLNKSFLTDFAKQHGVTVPASWTISNRVLPEGIVYPVITKSLTSTSGTKSDMVVCESEEELKRVVECESHCSDYQVQQFIEKEKEVSILGCVLPDGNVFFSGCIDKLRTCMIGTSSFAVMVDNDILADEKDKLIKMLIDTKYTGLFSAEYLLKDGKYYFLEVNFRNDGNTYVATSAGINLPYIWYCYFAKKELPKFNPIYPHHFMLDIEDFLAIRRNKISFFEWRKSVKQTSCFLVYNQMDKKPFLEKCKITTENILNRVIRKI